MIYRIVKYMNNPILERPCDQVTNFGSAELKQLVDDMFETMYASRGVGLAAPQIDIASRIAVVDVVDRDDDEHDSEDARGKEGRSKEEPQPIVLINPEVIAKDGKQTGEEGCLSIPGFREPVTRAKRATVRAQNLDGEWFEIEGEDLLARAFQHEIDHLNGILFLSHLSTLKRDLIKRKIRKLQKAGEWD